MLKIDYHDYQLCVNHFSLCRRCETMFISAERYEFGQLENHAQISLNCI